MAKQGKAFFITGKPGMGKTTMIKNLITQMGLYRCGGFFTEEVRQFGVRTGFKLVTLDGQSAPLAEIHVKSPARIGRYGVNIQTINITAPTAIYHAIENKEIIIIDEIGPMELFSENFKKALLVALDHEKPLIATIVSRPHPWADELKRCANTQIFSLTLQNRQYPDHLLKQITLYFGSAIPAFI